MEMKEIVIRGFKSLIDSVNKMTDVQMETLGVLREYLPVLKDILPVLKEILRYVDSSNGILYRMDGQTEILSGQQKRLHDVLFVSECALMEIKRNLISTKNEGLQDD